MTRRRAVALPVLLLGPTLAGCTDETSPGEDPVRSTCVGEESGDISFTVGDSEPLAGGASIAIASMDLDSDPVAIDLGIAGGTPAEEEATKDLAPGDSFEVAGRSYVLNGACDDAVWMDPAG